jgi:NADPH:quinone reductase-like Zn-dependent oxidoreductase
MRAAVYRRYGPPEVVRIEQVPKPRPKANEVLIRVHASTVSAADWRLRQADPFFARLFFGLFAPKRGVLGMELSGTVEEVGRKVTRFAVGDQVFGLAGLRFGGHGEYVCLPEKGELAKKPANIGLDEAAAVCFGGFTALRFLRAAGIGAGQRVLVCGASGSVGVFAVQLARHFGARVTGVCSTANLELVKSLGAEQAVDYTREDYSKAGPVYDIVFDTVGKGGFSRSMRSLKPEGTYACCAPQWAGLAPFLARIGGRKLVTVMAKADPADLAFLASLIEAGKLRTVIDRRYPLARIVEGHRHAQAGHKKGHVLVLVEQGAA